MAFQAPGPRFPVDKSPQPRRRRVIEVVRSGRRDTAVLLTGEFEFLRRLWFG